MSAERPPIAPGVDPKPEGHERVVYQGSKPSSETGVWLHKHDHEWQEIGAERWPVGTWHPVFRCYRCGDVICDLHTELPAEVTKAFDQEASGAPSDQVPSSGENNRG